MPDIYQFKKYILFLYLKFVHGENAQSKQFQEIKLLHEIK